MKNNNLLHRIIIITWILSFLTSTAGSQGACNDDIIMGTKGAWKNDRNYMKSGNQAPITTRIDKMQKLLQAAYPEPKGIEANWYRSMNNDPLIANGPTPYQLNSLFLAYFCNTNTNNELQPGGETGTWFYVWANDFNWFVYRVSEFKVKKQPVYLLTPQVGVFNGYPLYNGIHNENSNTGVKYSRAIIITRDGSSPYTPVTKQQYLKLFLLHNEKKLSEELASIEKNTPVKTDAEEEAYKKSQLEKVEKTSYPDKVARAKDYFLRGYMTDKQRKAKWIVDTKQRYLAQMKPVQELLVNSTGEELAQAAIVEGEYLSRFERFGTIAKGGRELVTLNPDYFDSKLPKYVPQFLIVYWRWDKGRAQENFKTQLEAGFDFTALKEMIDK